MSFYDATVPAYSQDPVQPLRPAHQGRGPLRDEEDPARRAAQRPALSGHAALAKQIQLACDFAAKGCARLTHSEVPSTPDNRKDLRRIGPAAGEHHRLSEDLQAGAVRGRGCQGRHLPVRTEHQPDIEGPGVYQPRFVSELLLPRAIAHGLLAPQRRRGGKARFPRGGLTHCHSGAAQRANPESRATTTRFRVCAPPKSASADLGR